jgi:hypothetical protein
MHDCKSVETMVWFNPKYTIFKGIFGDKVSLYSKSLPDYLHSSLIIERILLSGSS